LSFSNCRAAILLNIAAKLHPRNGNNVRGKELRIKVEDEFLDNFLGVWCITPMMSKDSEGILSKSVQIFSYRERCLKLTMENLNTYQRNYDHHCLSYRYSDLLIQDL
jgi:hypothetical protein